MNILCEMNVSDYFKLSTGHTALVGIVEPDLDEVLGKCKAYLYIGDKKLHTIDIIGEDEFNRVNEGVRKSRRAVRTLDNVAEDLDKANGQQIKLVFYSE